VWSSHGRLPPGGGEDDPFEERIAGDVPVRAQLIGPVLEYVRARGGDVDKLCQVFGLEGVNERTPEVTLPLSRLRAFYAAAASSSKDPFLGLSVAGRLRHGHWGVLEFSARSAPCVREALQRVAEYSVIYDELVVIRFEPAPGGGGSVHHHIPGRPLGLGPHGNECFVATVLLRLREHTGAALTPERIWFAHPAPADLSPLVAVLGTPRLSFNAEESGFTLSGASLATPLRTSDAPLLALLDSVARETAAENTGPNRFLGRLRQQIRESLAAGGPVIEDMARALRVSPRTLQRRLANEGTYFQQLVDAVRAELALRYVKEGRLSLREVACQLGYAEPSAFLRAFKRWTGKTPRQFRG
jgi:AraC-like DNA-binding protein